MDYDFGDAKAAEVAASWIRVPRNLSQSDAGEMLLLDHIARASHLEGPLTVVRWAGATFFSSPNNKGAKSLVVSSRKLDIAPELVEAHKLRGVQVCNLPGCDPCAHGTPGYLHQEYLIRGTGTKNSGEVSTVENAYADEATRKSATQPSAGRNDGLRGVQGYEKENIDLEAESRPPVDMVNTLAIPKSRRVSFPSHVAFLTGCTGLLGHHLLSYFIADRPVEKVNA
ncbi:hypothetical protein CIB48_g104 [Xylaria polymorpha]|nr:hypothetical protein CIB48_g104 [Xylaria polymorpha]